MSLKIRKINTVSYELKYSIPNDFDSKIYRQLHWDLKDYTNKQATKHFIKYGIKEGRKYKHNQKILVIGDFVSSNFCFED